MRLLSFAPLLVVAACASAPADSGVSTATTEYTSQHPGMGGLLHDGGATFRVWAPAASQVWVTGDFNHWNWDELSSEWNGHWSTFVAGARVHQKYKYVIRDRWGNVTQRQDPRAQRVENSSGAAILHDPSSYPWRHGVRNTGRNETVIYELHVGSFHRKGDGPGTFRTAVEKLDYLRDLGVSAVELMPILEFPGDFSWGYNPASLFAPESAYGSPDDFKWFVDEAHARGIGVIVDVVHNHWGPNDLATWCFSGDCLGSGGEYFYSDWRGETPWGHTRPDYGRPQVRDFVKDQAAMLLREYRVDGLRFDSTKYMRTVNGGDDTSLADGWRLLREITDQKNASEPWKLLVAEDFGAGDAMTKPTSRGGAGFDAQWSGDFVHPVRAAIAAPQDSWRDMGTVRDAITQRFNGRPSERIIYTESHDEVANGQTRLPEKIWPGNAGSWASKKRSTLGAAVLFTSPGIPLIFQGQEFLEDGWFSAERPLDWDKAGRYAGITQLYRDLAFLRRNGQNQTRGLRGDNVNVFHVNDGSKVIAYHRWDQGGPGDDVIVVANFSSTWFEEYRVAFPRAGTWHVRFNSDYRGYSPDFGGTATFDVNANGGGRDGLPVSGTLGVGPYSVVILSQ